MRRKLRRLKNKHILRHQRHMRRLQVWGQHPVAVPFMVFVVLLILTTAGYLLLVRPNPPALNARVVIISHDHTEQVVPSIEPTVGQLIKKLNLTINQGDVIEPAPSTPINQDDFRINIYRAVPVEIVDGAQRTFTFSAATTPRAIANQAGKTLYAEDIVNTDPVANFVTTGSVGEQVVIDRSQAVDLNLYGTPLTIRTHATTVAQLIKDKNIQLAKDDQVTPAPDTPITPNLEVFIERNGTKIESDTQTIPMPVQTIEDNTLAYGTSAVRQTGSAGQEVITYQINLQNGHEIGRTPIQTVITQPAVTEIVVQGTNLAGIKGDMALAGISPDDYNYVDYIVSHESGWCPTKAQGEHTCPTLPDDAMTPNGYGLCQSTPGYKMASAGSDWQTNPVTQLSWCNGYAMSRYGSWYAAYMHWLSYHNW